MAVKIGYTKNFSKRFSNLQASNPAPLSMLFCIKGGRDKEKRIHDALDRYKIRGEWFDFSEPMVQAAIFRVWGMADGVEMDECGGVVDAQSTLSKSKLFGYVMKYRPDITSAASKWKRQKTTCAKLASMV